MKVIPIALQAHYEEDTTTTCLLTRIELKSGVVIGFTDLDMPVAYDDGDGAVTYSAENGFTPSRSQATADLAVDNAELAGVVSDDGITLAQIRSGLFDYAKVRVYRVNYMDLTQGHEVIAVGTAGETRFSLTGWVTEFRSLTQQLKQPISRLYSKTCRARFGSMPIGTADGSFEELYPCGKSFTWVSGTVTSLGTNHKRQFSDSALTQPDNYFAIGVVEWLTGNNAGAQMEVDAHASDALTLALPMPFAIQVGDTYRVRKDCSKEWGDASNGCLFHWGPDRSGHFRGEKDIPTSDAGQSMVPGAQVSRTG